jgi:hypothetical protein
MRSNQGKCHRPFWLRTKFDIATAVSPSVSVLLKFVARPDRMLHALVSTMVKSMGDDRRDCQAERGSVDIRQFLKDAFPVDIIFFIVNNCFKIGIVKKNLTNSY